MTYTKESVERLVEACRTQATIYPATSMLLVAALSSLTLETPRVKDETKADGGDGTIRLVRRSPCPYCGGEIKEVK
jgi:hypothetical protein